MSRVNIVFLVFVGLVCLPNCSFWTQEPVPLSEENPTITVANLVEIKEQILIDDYGFKQRQLVADSKIKRNESIYTILNGYGVSPQTIYAINNEAKGVFNSNSLRPGQRYLVYKNPLTDKIDRLIVHFDRVNYVVFDWADKIWVDRGSKEVSTIQKVTSGVITSSLYQSLKDNDVNPLLGSKLSEIFAWQVDFFSLQPNDQFTIVYEQPYLEDEPYGVGEIVAATFTHKGRVYDAFFYETDERAGYFDKSGNGLQKALLKAPFKYSQRVSSGFSHNRFHPVLKKSMPHYGVDYAAPIGTPVIAVGDGEVVEARYRGANGNIVKIKHNGVYTTAYLHLNGFAPGIRRGVRVKQGQTIGYVGRTGRVTGVHLDYRIYKNDQPVNPLSIELPASKSLQGHELEEFQLFIERYRYTMRDELMNLLALNN